MYQFNTWTNEQLREAMTGVSAEYLRRPSGLWFKSALDILTHIYAGEAIWLARLRDGVDPPRLLTAADVGTTLELVESWRTVDRGWEEYVASLTSANLDEIVNWTSQMGDSFGHVRWQLVMHVAFHSSEHRAHAGTALTQLGLSHGPQDFLYQFMPVEAVRRRSGRPVG
jgi:uncharacterized damage-inducible protein DinB